MAARPTPHSIALAALISLHCEENSPLYPEDNDNGFPLVDAFLQDSLLNRSRPWTQSHDRRIATLLQKLAGSVNQELARNFQKWLDIAASSIDAMTDLLMTVQQALQEGSVDSESANGMFLRSVCLGFDELPFEATVDLWEAFRVEVDEVQNPDAEPIEHGWALTSEQREMALREECISLAVQPNPLGLQDFHSHLLKILEHNPELPSAHFLRFLNCLQSGERVGAVEALHQYMDYALIRETDRDEILQFAAILKAALHHTSGDKRLSKAATEEAVRVAQQSQDTACVAFALGWLSVHATDSEQACELMGRCVQRAGEGNLRTLVAGANLSLAVASLQTENPTRAWVHLNDAAADSPTADTSNPLDRPTHMAQLDSADDALGIVARQELVAAGVWQGFGQNTLSKVASVGALHCHRGRMNVQDMLGAVQNIARTVLFGSNQRDLFHEMVSRLHPQFRSLEKDYHEVALSECIYGTALQALTSLRKELGLPSDRNITLSVFLVAHEWAVRRGDFRHAETLIVALHSQLNPLAHNYDEVCTDIAAQHSLLLSRQGRIEDAESKLRNVIQKCKNENKVTRAAELLLQLAMIDLEADRQQFINALSPLMECLSLSKKYELDSLHAAALSVFAQLHLRMGNPKRALGVVSAVLPSLLQNGHTSVQAEAYLTTALCYLHVAKGSKAEENRQNGLNSAVDALHRSAVLFTKCQDCMKLKEVYYLLARTCNEIPSRRNSRNEYAEQFMRISSHSDGCCVASETDEFISDLSDPGGIAKLASRSLPSIIKRV